MATIAEIRQKYPQYSDMTDGELAAALYRKSYSDMTPIDFAKAVGIDRASAPDFLRNAVTVSPDRAASAAASDAKAEDMMRTNSDRGPQGWEQYARGAAAGGTRGVVNMAGTVADAVAWPVVDAANALGADMRMPSEALRSGVEAATNGDINYRAPGLAGDVLGTGMEFATSAGLMGAPMVRAGFVPGVTSELAGQATEGTKAEPYARFGGAIAGGVAADALRNLGRNSAARSAYVRSAPASEKLREQAAALYEKGHQRGVTVSPSRMQPLVDDLKGIAEAKGFITPSGRVSDVAGEMKAVLRDLEDYMSGPVNTQQLQALRTQLQVVAGSQTPKIAERGVTMLKRFDDFMDGVAPEFRQANALYTRAMRGDMMNKVEDLADVRASQYTQSGSENALRAEFRKLDRDIIRGRTKGLRPDQISAVQDVSRGTRATNAARTIGKAAPTGPIAAAASGGLPFMVGNAVGGPALGSALSAGTMGTGLLGRMLATNLQNRAADYASATMRSATPMALPEGMSKLGLLSYLAAQGGINSKQ